MKNVLIVDSTLRDGSHAIGHQFKAADITRYAKGAEAAGIPILVVGHGNGLGASSLQLGFSLLTDSQMLQAARKQLKKTKLGAFLIPGFGTIKRDIDPAIECGVEAMMIASHCTEANVTKEHIEYVTKKRIRVYGVLMMTHMIDADALLEQARMMQGYGAVGVLIMDSAGAYLPEDVKFKIDKLANGLKIDVGFHPHNNLGLAVANALAAVYAGAKIIDGTTRGLGAGAGNCQLEVFLGVCQKLNIKTSVDLYKLMDLSENIIAKVMKYPQEISSASLTSGLAGVFSGFAPHAKRAAKHYKVDVRDIFVELGKRKIIAGQEDIIVDVAVSLEKKKTKNLKDYAR